MSQFRVGKVADPFNDDDSFNNNTHFINNNTNSLKNTITNTTSFNSVSNVNNYRSATREKVLAWLSLLETRILNHSIRTRRVKHVGDWLLWTEEYWNSLVRWCWLWKIRWLGLVSLRRRRVRLILSTYSISNDD